MANPSGDSDSCPLLSIQHDPATLAFRQFFFTYHKVQRRIEEMLAPHGLVLSQFEAIIKIGMRPGIIQQELVTALLVTKGNVGALLDRLELMGLVERRPDPGDRRANRLHLTPNGRSLLDRLCGEYHALLRVIMQPLSLEQLGTFEMLLKRIEP